MNKLGGMLTSMVATDRREFPPPEQGPGGRPFRRRLALATFGGTAASGVAAGASGLLPAGVTHLIGSATPAFSEIPARLAQSLRGGSVILNPYAGLQGDGARAPDWRWWRGQLHTHTARSFDGDPAVPPDRRASLYRRESYDFVFLTDHDRVSAVPSAAASALPGVTAYPGVESSHVSAHLGVWLLNLPAGARLPEPSAIERSQDPAARAEAWTAAGGLVCWNHPSHTSAPLTVTQIATWAGAGVPMRFLEVFNTRANRTIRDTNHNVLAWHAAISAAGPDRPVWGVASDDSHSVSDTGGAWVAVASTDTSGTALRDALLAGRFYASNGPAFIELGVDEESGTIFAAAPTAESMQFIAANGAPVVTTTGGRAHYTPQPHDGWVRVEARDASGRTAWSQPFWLV